MPHSICTPGAHSCKVPVLMDLPGCLRAPRGSPAHSTGLGPITEGGETTLGDRGTCPSKKAVNCQSGQSTCRGGSQMVWCNTSAFLSSFVMRLSQRSPYTKLLVGVFSRLLQEKPLVTENTEDLRATVIGRKENHQ